MEEDTQTQTPSINSSDEFSTGYEIRLCVYSDGTFGVKGPEPLPEDREQSGDLTSVTEAHKAIHDLFRQHPVGENEQAEFEAGFGQDPRQDSATESTEGPTY